MKIDLKKIKFQILPVLKGAGVVQSSIFGSFATGKARKDSDVDILVELKGGKTLFDLVELKMDLESKLKRKVDLVTYKSVSPLLKNIIDAEKIDIL